MKGIRREQGEVVGSHEKRLLGSNEQRKQVLISQLGVAKYEHRAYRAYREHRAYRAYREHRAHRAYREYRTYRAHRVQRAHREQRAHRAYRAHREHRTNTSLPLAGWQRNGNSGGCRYTPARKAQGVHAACYQQGRHDWYHKFKKEEVSEMNSTIRAETRAFLARPAMRLVEMVQAASKRTVPTTTNGWVLMLMAANMLIQLGVLIVVYKNGVAEGSSQKEERRQSKEGTRLSSASSISDEEKERVISALTLCRIIVTTAVVAASVWSKYIRSLFVKYKYTCDSCVRAHYQEMSTQSLHQPRLSSSQPRRQGSTLSIETTEEVSPTPTDSSVMMSSGIVNMMPLLPPGSAGAPSFNGRNVTEFLTQFDGICDDANINHSKRAVRVVRYCAFGIQEYLRTLPEYNDQDWDALKAVLMKDYESSDDYQRTRTLAFLEALKSNHGREDHEVRQYCRLFKVTAMHLKKKGQLNDFQCGMWFVQGLPEGLRRRLVKEMKIDINDASTLKFEMLYNRVIQQCDVTDQLSAFDYALQGQDFSRLVKPARPVVVEEEVPVVTRAEGQVPHVSDIITPIQKVDYERDLIEKMTKLAIRGLRSEMKADIEAAVSFHHPSHNRARNDQGGHRPYVQRVNEAEGRQRAGPRTFAPLVGLDPARESNNTRSNASPYTCWYCGEQGHTTKYCRILSRAVADGKCHQDEDNRICFGPAGERGARVSVPRGEPMVSAVETWFVEQEGRAADQSRIRVSTKSVRIGLFAKAEDVAEDTEDEDCGYAGAAFRNSELRNGEMTKNDDGCTAVTIHGARASPTARNDTVSKQGPSLDSSRRVTKERQNKESRFPATRTLRSGAYNSAILGRVEDEAQDVDGPISALEKEGVEEFVSREVEMAEASSTVPPRVRFVEDRRIHDGNKLAKALTYTKDSSTQQLAAGILQQPITVTVGNLLAGSTDVRKMVFSSKGWEHDEEGVHRVGRDSTGKKVSQVRLDADRSVSPVYTSPCPEVFLTVPSGRKIRALIDTGAEVNVMSERSAKALKLPITRLRTMPFRAVSFEGRSQDFVGIVKNMDIVVHGVKVRGHVFVTEDMDDSHVVILGAPYQLAAKLRLSYEDKGSCVCQIYDSESDGWVEFEATQCIDPAVKLERASTSRGVGQTAEN